ncbi:RHS repeat-associated core domain-containing protein [Pseudomonas sp. TWI929]|uniref:RHS repeat-associated core domain-containing protein n=1 Tax=Pseudomonas sp. TWI929 TaxID=3136795 RepID=UPI003209B40E
MKIAAEQRGLAQQVLSYTAYGHLPARVTARLGFNGEMRDSVMQAYALGNGHRFYRPALMRFLNPDAMSPFGRGGVNAYCYCEGDPINNADPSGRMKAVSGAMKLNKVPRQPITSLEAFPNELISRIVDHLPVESVHKFAQTSSRMYDIAMDVPLRQRQAFDQIIAERPLSREQMVEVALIASGDARLPARVLIGAGIARSNVDKALLNPDQAVTQASLIRIDNDRRAQLVEATRGPLPWPFNWISIE